MQGGFGDWPDFGFVARVERVFGPGSGTDALFGQYSVSWLGRSSQSNRDLPMPEKLVQPSFIFMGET